MKYHRLNGSAIAALREAAGISQADLARECGISPSHLSHMESDRRQCSPPVAARIALRLGVALADIMSPVEAA